MTTRAASGSSSARIRRNSHASPLAAASHATSNGSRMASFTTLVENSMRSVTAAIADERGVLKPGQRVAFLGIGSGLNCMMMGVEW